MCKTPWQDDNLQFPRLLAELEAIGAFADDALLRRVAEEMDLEPDEVLELVSRAQAKWDTTKQSLLRS